MHGVRVACGVHRPLRGDERLCEYLTAEYTTGADIAVAAAINVDLERFEIEQGKEFVQWFSDVANLDGVSE